jgi:hypothetical protein
MKKLILILTWICLSLPFFAQEQYVSYGYDPAGNRISRTLVNLSKSDNSDTKKLAETQNPFSEGTITIAPNPTDGLLLIGFKDILITDQASIYLYDISGKMVLNQKIRSDREEVDFKNSPSGTYILKIINGKQQIEYMVIKE